MTAPARLGPFTRLWSILSPVLVALGAVLATMPLAPMLPMAGLDNAWAIGMNAAVGQGLAFGRDLIFTFGPYAGIYTWVFSPATDGMVLAGTALLAAALTAGLLQLTARRGRLGAVLLALFLSQLWLRDAVFFGLAMLFVAVAHRQAEARRPSLAWIAPGLLAAALALIPLVKGTFAAASGLALGLGCVLLLMRRNLALAASLVLLVLLAMPAFWLASGQALADLPVFFLSQGEIIRGYTPAMALAGPWWQVGAAAAAAGVVLLANLPGLAARRLPGLVVWLAAAALLFLSFKAGMVRQDGHIIIAGGGVALIAWVLLLGAEGDRRRLLPLGGLAAGLAAWAALDHAASGAGPREMAARLGRAAADTLAGVRTRLHPGAMTARYEDRLAALRREQPLPGITGPVDIYSVGQTALLAHGLRWAPRPVLQSYSAYTPALAALNAAHLTGPGAPETVLLALEAIDNRLAALEDGLSWPILLTRYEAVGRQGALAVLRRLPDAGPPPAEPTEGVVGPVLSRVRHGFGERVALPPDPPALWARIVIAPTFAGRMASVLLRPPAIELVLHYADGKTIPRRLIPGAAEAGFLIAPTVEDARQFLALAAPDLGLYQDLRPVAFTLSVAPGGEAFWEAGYALELSPFQVPARASAAAALLVRPGAATPAPGGGRCSLDMVNGAIVDHARPVPLGGAARLNGWGYALLPAAAEPSAVALALTAPDGTVREIPAELMPRPDVGQHFGEPGLVRVGFQALADLSGLRGPYGLSLTITAGGTRQSCALTRGPAILAGAAPSDPPAPAR